MMKYLSPEDVRDRLMAHEGIEYVYISVPNRSVSTFGGFTLLHPICAIVPNGQHWMVRCPDPADPSKIISIHAVRSQAHEGDPDEPPYRGIALAVASTHGHPVAKSLRRMMDRSMRNIMNLEKEMNS